MHILGDLCRKGNYTFKLDFKKHPQASPYKPTLSSQKEVRDVQPLKSLKVLLDAYTQFDLNSTLLHFHPVKVSLGVPLQGVSLNIVLFLD